LRLPVSPFFVTKEVGVEPTYFCCSNQLSYPPAGGKGIEPLTHRLCDLYFFINSIQVATATALWCFVKHSSGLFDRNNKPSFCLCNILKNFFVTPVRFERTLCFRNSPAVNTLPYFGLSHFGVPIAIEINSIHSNEQSERHHPATPWNQFYHSASLYAKERLLFSNEHKIS
jgi:hypothetical protein